MKKRIIFMDVLTCLSALFVVFLHSSSTVADVRVDRGWIESLFIQSFFRWPVPIFFMISGANLLSYRTRYSTKSFFEKRFKKVLIPFIIWSFIWLAYGYKTGGIMNLSLHNVINLFVYNNIQNIFWFFYIIIGIYLCIPILSKLTKKENKQIILYFILLCLIQTGIIPIVFELLNLPTPWYTSLPIIGGFLSYVLTGWYLITFPLDKKSRFTVYLCGITSALLIFIGTFYLSLPQKQLSQLLFDYNSICTYFTSVAVFVFVQSIKWDKLNKQLIYLITIISSTSFGVYIVHEFFMSQIERHFHVDITTTFHLIIYPIIIYSISAIFVYILKRIPLIKHIMP